MTGSKFDYWFETPTIWSLEADNGTGWQEIERSTSRTEIVDYMNRQLRGLAADYADEPSRPGATEINMRIVRWRADTRECRTWKAGAPLEDLLRGGTPQC